MPFRRIRDRRRREALAHDLYLAMVEQARLPAFYLGMGVPDTLDGRFDMILLHAFLVMRQLGGTARDGAGGEEAKALSQALFDLMFADMDQNLREMGVGDLSVGKKVKQMANAFYGRVAAYEAALATSGAALEEALARNLYGTVQPGPAELAGMAAYLRTQAAHLAAEEAGPLLEGRVAFLPPEAPHGA